LRSCGERGAWIVWHAEPLAYIEMAVIGPLHGDW